MYIRSVEILKYKIFLCMTAPFVLIACAPTSQTVTTMVPIKAETLISNSASVGHTLVLDKKTSFVTCTTPAPDAVFSQGESASLSVMNPGGVSEGGGGSETSGESGLPGRTPSVLMARELFFRACEFSRNYELSASEATEIYNSTLSLVAKAWSKEAEHTAVTIGENQSLAQEPVLLSAQPPSNRVVPTAMNKDDDDADFDTDAENTEDLEDLDEDDDLADEDDFE